MILVTDCEVIPIENLDVPVENLSPDGISYIKINKIPRVMITKGRVRIPKPILESETLYIEITSGGQLYKSDIINLKRAVLLGDSYYDVYPGSFFSIDKRLKDLAQAMITAQTDIKKNENRIFELETKGDLL